MKMKSERLLRVFKSGSIMPGLKRRSSGVAAGGASVTGII